MTPCPSPEWEVLLEPFRPLFSQPGFRYFCAFVLVFAHLDRRLWVTRVILSGLIADRHFTSFYRFLREGTWSVAAVRQQVWTLCRARCEGEGGRLFVGADDTVAPKWGKRFFGLGWHHDPMNRQHPKKLTHGHCFVCLAGLAEQTPDHFVSLFLGCALYVQEKVCRGKRAFATKLALAARLAGELALAPGQVLGVVVDGGYARQAFSCKRRSAGGSGPSPPSWRWRPAWRGNWPWRPGRCWWWWSMAATPVRRSLARGGLPGEAGLRHRAGVGGPPGGGTGLGARAGAGGGGRWRLRPSGVLLQEEVCRGKRAFATELALAARLAGELALAPGQVLVVVVDGGYARQAFSC